MTPDALLLYANAWEDAQAIAKPDWDAWLWRQCDYIGGPLAVRAGFRLSDDPPPGLKARRVSAPLLIGSKRPRPTSGQALRVGAFAPLAVIVLNRDHLELLDPLMHGLQDHTDGLVEIIVLDNGSVEPDTLAYLQNLRSDPSPSN